MDGVAIPAIEGESIAAAVIASGRLDFRRDKEGAARGYLCGMGTCFECEVVVDGVPARACMTKARDGMRVQSGRYRANPRVAAPSVAARINVDCDVLVVGAGPAGLTAACELAEAGARVVVAEERSDLGGQFFKPLASSHGFSGRIDEQYAHGRKLIERARSSGAELLTGALVWSASRNETGTIQAEIDTSDGAIRCRARHVILATGARESVPAFEGWTLPGVMTTGGAQSLVRAYRVAPGQRVLIAGNGPLNLQLAAELLDGGIQVAAIAEAAPHPATWKPSSVLGALASSPALMLRGVALLAKVRRRGVPVWWGHQIVRASGDLRVRSATIARKHSDGQVVADSEREIEADAVCVGYRLRPSNELARLLGCKLEADPSGQPIPVRDAHGRSSIPNVFIIGDGGVIGGAHVAMGEGALAAAAIARDMSLPASPDAARHRRRTQRHRRFQKHLWSLFESSPQSVPPAHVHYCRCELVRGEQLGALVERGMTDLDALKRATRAGMGPCQGRYCGGHVEALVRRVRTPTRSGSARPPVKPLQIGKIAAEKPEWHGYRAVDIPPPAPAPQIESREWHADVVVIGAGIIGVTTALYLARAGVDVMLIDQGTANCGASGANAGSLHLQLLSWDISREDAAALAAQTVRLQQLGIATWLELQHELDAEFELKLTGGIVVAETPEQLEFLRYKAELDRRFGAEVHPLSRSDVQRMIPCISERIIGGVYCPGEGKINPMLATPAVLQEALRCGARFMPHTGVTSLTAERSGYVVGTRKGTIRCGKVVNAAGGWSAGVAALLGIHLPLRAAPQQMIVTEPTDASIEYLLAFAQRHLTMKQSPNGNVIIGGGWPGQFDPVAGKAVTLIESIEGNLWVAQRVVPLIGQLRMLRSWATLGVMIDGAPIIGEHPSHPGFFNAVGANGFTMGPILGKIIAELVTRGEAPTDIRPFSVERFGSQILANA